MNLKTFLEMGGYAAYVWPCYAFTALAIGWMILSARRVHRDALAAARKRFESGKPAP